MTNPHKIKRWNQDYIGMFEHKQGYYVEYSDYRDLCRVAKKALDAMTRYAEDSFEVEIEALKKELDR